MKEHTTEMKDDTKTSSQWRSAASETLCLAKGPRDKHQEPWESSKPAREGRVSHPCEQPHLPAFAHSQQGQPALGSNSKKHQISHCFHNRMTIAKVIFYTLKNVYNTGII